MTSKYYAVRRGRIPGIYTDWISCREQVAGFGGAVFKSFTSKAAAEQYLQESPEQITKDGLPVAYIDGSISKKNGCYAWGGFIVYNGQCRIVQGKGNNPVYLPERNIAGELIGTLQILFECMKMDISEIILCFDYAGIELYVTGDWKARTPLAIYYRDTVQLIADEVKIHFQKVKGHTGVEGNELADYLAKEAAGVKLRKKDIEALAAFRRSGLSTII